MRIIGTVGLPGSGKGEAAAVAREDGVPVVVMGDVVREECRTRGLDPAEHHGEIAGRLREEEGDDVIAERSLPRIREAIADVDGGKSPASEPTVLVDGIRSGVEVDRFREAFGDDFLLISVEAPFDLRADRLADRDRDESDDDLEALRERDERELEMGMGEVMDAADARIDNTGTLAAFRATVRRLLRKGEAALADEEVRADADP